MLKWYIFNLNNKAADYSRSKNPVGIYSEDSNVSLVSCGWSDPGQNSILNTVLIVVCES